MKYCLLNLIAFFLLVTLTHGGDDHGSSIKVSAGAHSHGKEASSGSSSDAVASAKSASKADSSSSSSSSSSKSESSEASAASAASAGDDKDNDDDDDKSNDTDDKSAKSSGNSIHQSAQYAKLRQAVSQVASKVASHSANLLSTFGDHLVGMLDDLTNRI